MKQMVLQKTLICCSQSSLSVCCGKNYVQTFVCLRQMTSNLAKSDFLRLLLLVQEGGIYLDLDVITLKPVNQLRVYPATIGR